MKFSTKIRAVLVVLFTTLALTVVGAPSASAHYNQCPSGQFCLWQHSNYEGDFFGSSTSTPNLGAFNDRASSFWNRTGNWVTVWQHANYQADGLVIGFGVSTTMKCITVPPGGSTPAIIGGFNDMASSFSLTGAHPLCFYHYP